MDEKFTRINEQFAQGNERFDRVEENIKDINARNARIEERLNLMARGMNEIVASTRNQAEFFAEFLGFRKILEPVAFIKNELLRLSARTLTNPLTKEEAQRMRELIEKEKLTLQEADELREIARKLVSEYGAIVPEV
jgi:septal ring factor EnvC (AmiA/AmiB activator)